MQINYRVDRTEITNYLKRNENQTLHTTTTRAE